MAISTTFRDELLAVIPHLRAHAQAMCHNAALADDLVQDTIVRCWSKCHQYEPGTNFAGWAYTILRNLYISHVRRHRREVEDATGAFAATLVSSASQEASSELADLRRALMQLPQSQRDALLLVTIEDLSCEEAAKVLGCNVGTVKSRVSRARDTLAKIMGDDRRPARQMPAQARRSDIRVTDRKDMVAIDRSPTASQARGPATDPRSKTASMSG